MSGSGGGRRGGRSGGAAGGGGLGRADGRLGAGKRRGGQAALGAGSRDGAAVHAPDAFVVGAGALQAVLVVGLEGSVGADGIAELAVLDDDLAAVVMAVVSGGAGLLALEKGDEVELRLHAGHGSDGGSGNESRAEEQSVDHLDGVVDLRNEGGL